MGEACVRGRGFENGQRDGTGRRTDGRDTRRIKKPPVKEA